MRLSPRLDLVAALVPEGKIVADIGTDHARLPLFLVEQGICPRVIAVELNEGPYRVACRQVRKRGAGDRIQVRRGHGFSAIKPGEVEVAVMAGLGGRTIIHIVRNHPAVTEKISHFILQPMTDGEELRLWLSRHYFRIVTEALVAEEGRLYEVIVAQHGVEPASSEVLLSIGPRLVAERHPLLAGYLDRLLKREKAILAEMEQAAVLSPENWEKIRYLKTRVAKLEGIRRCS